MKSIVIYCSLTGSTEKIARAIQAGVKKAAGSCDIQNIRDANPKKLYEYELIGLGSFVKGIGPPNVISFIENLQFLGGKHVFCFSTHGLDFGKYFPNIHPKLTEKGLTVIGMADWFGSVNIYHAPKPYPTDGHPDKEDLKEAEDFGAAMVERSRKIAAGDTGLIPPVPKVPEKIQPPPGSPPMGPPKFPKPIIETLKFDKEKCTYPKCRLCMDICPVFGIDVTVNPPVIAKPCYECEMCLKVCPTGALTADEFMDFTVPDTPMGAAIRIIFLPWLEKEIAAGRYRNHVSAKDIGWNTPLSKTMKGVHPQWVIGKGWVNTDK